MERQEGEPQEVHIRKYKDLNAIDIRLRPTLYSHATPLDTNRAVIFDVYGDVRGVEFDNVLNGVTVAGLPHAALLRQAIEAQGIPAEETLPPQTEVNEPGRKRYFDVGEINQSDNLLSQVASWLQALSNERAGRKDEDEKLRFENPVASLMFRPWSEIPQELQALTEGIVAERTGREIGEETFVHLTAHEKQIRLEFHLVTSMDEQRFSRTQQNLVLNLVRNAGQAGLLEPQTIPPGFWEFDRETLEEEAARKKRMYSESLTVSERLLLTRPTRAILYAEIPGLESFSLTLPRGIGTLWPCYRCALFLSC